MRFIALLAIIMVAVLFQPEAADAAADPADPATLDRGAHPGSVGFADPADLDALLGYRLPDWGWRTWTFAGTLHGAGSARDRVGVADAHQLSYMTNLLTATTWYRESEPRTWEVSADLRGDWNRTRGGSDLWTRALHGRYEVSARLEQYLVDDRWFVGLDGWAAGSYEDRRNERPGDAPDHVLIRRGHDHTAGIRAGWGRIRDVTPLVRAQRLAERLVALGRPRPAAAQIQAAARVLAQENGYQRVYARPDRRLWDRILAPLTGGEPLSVAEVFYLREVMVEDLGMRRQGSQVAGVIDWRQDGLTENVVTRPGLGLQAETWRNLSLTLQLSATARATWSWVNQPDPDFDTRTFEVQASSGLRWNVIDRIRVGGSLWGVIREYDREWSSGNEISRSLHAAIEARFYVEDRMYVRPRVELAWEEWDLPEAYERDVRWSYGVSFGYDLDGVIF